jgi:hypothetical protein
MTSRFFVGWKTLVGPKIAPWSNGPYNWCSHNGIVLPTAVAPNIRYLTNTEEFDLALPESVLVGPVALTDRLRPELSVSRDDIRAVPFAVHSAIQLAVRRAVADHANRPYGKYLAPIASADLIGIPPSGPFVAASLDDDLLHSGAWDTAKVFEGADALYSVEDLQRGFRAGTPIKLVGFVRKASWCDDFSEDAPFTFSTVLPLALAHLRLNLADDRDRRSLVDDEFDTWEEAPAPFLVDDQMPQRPVSVDLFPPLTFLPEVAGSELARNGSGAWNQRHPLIRWIIEHAETLAEQAPVAYGEIIGTFHEYSADLPNLLEILARVARVYPDLRPPPSFWRTPEKKGAK